MKKLLLTAAVLLASISHAASSGDLIISGTVSSVNELVITPKPESTQLNILAGETGLSVATVAETSNNLLGYKILMRSANASNLVHTINNAYKTAYTVSYDGGTAITLTNADQEVKNISSLSGLTTDNSDVSVNVTPYSTAPAGTYSDTITISIVAN